MIVQIEPTSEQVDKWIEKYVSNNDLFFIGEEDLITFGEYLSEVLVIPKDEFFNHSSYLQIQLANSYEYWQLSKNVQYIIVAQGEWIESIPSEDKKILLRLQAYMGRGLILSLSSFSNPNEIPLDYIVEYNGEHRVILQNEMWSKLSYSNKVQAIKTYALEWDNWECSDVPSNTPIHLKDYANSFSTNAGANCLAATLYAISAKPGHNEWIIHEWVHQKTFLLGLHQANYVIANDELQEGDVVTWMNQEKVIQHAAYHIGNNLFFNKNGQTFFNPWKIIHWDLLNDEWNKYSICVYRKTKRKD